MVSYKEMCDVCKRKNDFLHNPIYRKDKIWLQIPLKKIKMPTYFEKLTVKLHVLYIFNIFVKFRVNWTLFIIRFINLFFMHNFRLQKFEI